MLPVRIAPLLTFTTNLLVACLVMADVLSVAAAER